MPTPTRFPLPCPQKVCCLFLLGSYRHSARNTCSGAWGLALCDQEGLWPSLGLSRRALKQASGSGLLSFISCGSNFMNIFLALIKCCWSTPSTSVIVKVCSVGSLTWSLAETQILWPQTSPAGRRAPGSSATALQKPSSHPHASQLCSQPTSSLKDV